MLKHSTALHMCLPTLISDSSLVVTGAKKLSGHIDDLSPFARLFNQIDDILSHSFLRPPVLEIRDEEALLADIMSSYKMLCTGLKRRNGDSGKITYPRNVRSWVIIPSNEIHVILFVY